MIQRPAIAMRSSAVPTVNLFMCLSLLSALATASGQTLPHEGRMTGPLEKPGMPPAPVGTYRLETSPRLISPYGGFVSYQVNVDQNGNNIVGDAANEPSICVDPTNGNKMSIGWRQFDSGSSNFRQAGFAHTANGGRTWISASVLQHNVFRSDPVLNSDNAGHFFYLSLLQNSFDDLWRSLDGGQSWISIAPADGV